MRILAVTFGLIGAAVFASFGCSSAGTKGTSDGDLDAGTDVAELPIVGTGLSCDVEQVLYDRCQGCHGAKPTYASPMALVTFDDLMAPAKTDSTRKVIDLVIERMQSADKPMPPPIATLATSTEIATIQAWIDAGYPQGECDLPPNGADAYSAASVCTTNAHWSGGDHGSGLMHPGGACITCHATAEDAPIFSIGGTAFKTAHEPDDCNGYNGTSGAKVVVTDAAGKTLSIPVNAAGNFYDKTTLKMPIHAKIVSKDGRERVMAEAQTTGDCNSCHTVKGTKNAPGRIVTP